VSWTVELPEVVDGLADLGEALGRGPVVEPQLLGELPDRGASGADAELEAACR
jgi:hypothetical protein